jgi:hypothetical protein
LNSINFGVGYAFTSIIGNALLAFGLRRALFAFGVTSGNVGMAGFVSDVVSGNIP